MPLEDQYLLNQATFRFPSGLNITVMKIYETLLFMALPWNVKDLIQFLSDKFTESLNLS